MKILNKYTYLFLILVLSAVIVIFAILPRFEKQEFNPDKISNISEGAVPTTTIASDNNFEEENVEITPEIIDIEKSEIEKLLINNIATKVIDGYKSYLLIGSDERDENSSESRGFVDGQRADVIIVGLIDDTGNNNYLLSIPRDTLIINICTENLERINGSYSKNNCGNNAENLAAAVKNITGIRVDHFASFNFEGFENIINSFNGLKYV